MEYDDRNITAVEVYKKLKEVEKELEETKEQNKQILAKLESMQETMKESNATFHTSFASVFEALQILNEVKQNEELRDMLDSGSVANILCAEQWKEKHMRKRSLNFNAVKITPEEANEIFDFLESLKAKNK